MLEYVSLRSSEVLLDGGLVEQSIEPLGKLREAFRHLQLGRAEHDSLLDLAMDDDVDDVVLILPREELHVT